jgi:hypothetical protein
VSDETHSDEHHDRTLSGSDERRLVTILFADIAGFTALAERIDPEEVQELLNHCFDALVPCIERYGGSVDKFMGDAVMALFGAPTSHENDAERAIRAALDIQGALRDFNRANDLDLAIHIGINTGLVIAETFEDLSPYDIPACLVAGHGPFCWGKDCHEAVFNAEVLEEIAALAYHSDDLDPELPQFSATLRQRHYYRKHGKNSYYGQ